MSQKLVRQQKLVCDACNNQVLIDRVHKGLVGTECEACGTNMLTVEDYRLFQRSKLRLFLTEAVLRTLAAFGLFSRDGVVCRVQIKDGEVISKLREGGVL